MSQYLREIVTQSWESGRMDFNWGTIWAVLSLYGLTFPNVTVQHTWTASRESEKPVF